MVSVTSLILARMRIHKRQLAVEGCSGTTESIPSYICKPCCSAWVVADRHLGAMLQRLDYTASDEQAVPQMDSVQADTVVLQICFKLGQGV